MLWLILSLPFILFTVVSQWIIPTEFHSVLLFDIYKLTFSKVTILQHCCQAGWQLWGISIFLVSFFLHLFCYSNLIHIYWCKEKCEGQSLTKILVEKIPLFCLARVAADKDKGIHLFLCIGHNSGPVTRLPAPSGSFHTNANAHTADGGLSSIHWKHTTN